MENTSVGMRAGDSPGARAAAVELPRAGWEKSGEEKAGMLGWEMDATRGPVVPFGTNSVAVGFGA